jgi:hypothetical protein
MGSRIVRFRLPVGMSVAVTRLLASSSQIPVSETLRDVAAGLRPNRRWMQEQRNFGSRFSTQNLLLTIGLEQLASLVSSRPNLREEIGLSVAVED